MTGEPDRILQLSVDLQRAQDENEQLRKWIGYLESSTFGMAEGLAEGLKSWVGDLRRMSPLRGDRDHDPVDPDQ